MRDFWPDEIRRVTSAYPAFGLRDRVPRPDLDAEEAERCGFLVRTWRGKMQPFSPTLTDKELREIVFDLYDGGPAISIDLNGTLRHNEQCPRHAHPLEADRVPRRSVATAYLVEVAYAAPPARPIVRSLHPPITQKHYPTMPHPIAPLLSLCVANAPTDPWDFEAHGALRYLDWTAYYLAKHTLWVERLERNGEAEWPGPGRTGDLEEEVRNPPDAECTCNSGRRYRDCHLTFDRQNVARRRQGLPVLPRPLGMAFYKQSAVAR